MCSACLRLRVCSRVHPSGSFFLYHLEQINTTILYTLCGLTVPTANEYVPHPHPVPPRDVNIFLTPLQHVCVSRPDHRQSIAETLFRLIVSPICISEHLTCLIRLGSTRLDCPPTQEL